MILNKKIYLTANIYVHNVKIKPFLQAMDMMIPLAPDGFIMTDPGLIMLVREKYPNVVIHLSTQANNVNWAQAKFWHKYLGIQRIILARELSIQEIAEIHKKVPPIFHFCNGEEIIYKKGGLIHGHIHVRVLFL